MEYEKRARDSESFNSIWTMVIQPVLRAVQAECDPYFVERCGLKACSSPIWKEKLYAEYLDFRDQLKNVCYGPSNQREAEELLDGRKIAAVLCGALIREKGFMFDSGQASAITLEKAKELKEKYGKDKGSVLLNLWAVQNIYINYKLAYYASLQMVYLTLMHDLLNKAKNEKNAATVRAVANQLATALNTVGHLYSYPQPDKGDGFDVNIIIGLARTDIARRDLDTFLFAMHLYQLEEHTIDKLKSQI